MKRLLYLLLIPVFFLGLCCGAFLPSLQALPKKIYESLDLFTKVLFLVERDYVEAVDGEGLVYGAIKGMLDTLDPYSVFLTPDVYKELKVDTIGRFGGVGLEVTLQDGVLTVVSAMEGTPAARAGIQSGDRILKINGTSTKGMGLVDAVRKMRGNQSSSVALTLWRKAQSKPWDVTLKREVIKIQSVKAQPLPSGILYVRVTNFQEDTEEDLRKALQAQASDSKGVILDLRNNPGGLLDEAVAVSDMFLNSGTIVSVRDRKGVSEVREAKSDDGYFSNPLVILINQGSASAAEIFSAALHDNQRAKLVGSKSFGKGSVQTVIDLGEEKGLKLTIAKYFTPSGKSINGTGIVPDYPVNDPKDFAKFTSLNLKEDKPLKLAESYLVSGKIDEKMLDPEAAKNHRDQAKEDFITAPGE